MGSLFSSPTPADEPTLPVAEHRPSPYFGHTVPPEASTAPQDSQEWYTDFIEEAFCAPHKDGKSIIICWPFRPGRYPDPREAEGWAVRRLRMMYERLGGDHPRIVRYMGVLESDESVVVEKVAVGPLKSLILPDMTTPMPAVEMRSRKDQVMLSLYYRWALQALSALSFMHSRSVYIKFSSSSFVWLRSDYSLAITGFISAIAASEYLGNGNWAPEYLAQQIGDQGMWAGDETFMYADFSNEFGGPCIEEDLFYWATFVWRLMTNEHVAEPRWTRGEMWEPVCPLEGGMFYSMPDVYQTLGERSEKNLYQELEDERLGRILVKAWNGQYKSTEEVTKEIKVFASKAGIIINGDEVEIEGGWENAFEMVQNNSKLGANRELRFKSPNR